MGLFDQLSSKFEKSLERVSCGNEDVSDSASTCKW